jgi:hypothetical protein
MQNNRNIWIQHVRQMDKDRLPHLIMNCQPCGRRSQGRLLQRLLDCKCDRNWSRHLKTCKLYVGDDDVLIRINDMNHFEEIKKNRYAYDMKRFLC